MASNQSPLQNLLLQLAQPPAQNPSAPAAPINLGPNLQVSFESNRGEAAGMDRIGKRGIQWNETALQSSGAPHFTRTKWTWIAGSPRVSLWNPSPAPLPHWKLQSAEPEMLGMQSSWPMSLHPVTASAHFILQQSRNSSTTNSFNGKGAYR